MKFLMNLRFQFIKPFLKPYRTSSRLITTKPPFHTTSKIPQYDKEATIYREKIRRNGFDFEAIYELAKCLSQGATIHYEDTRLTRFYNIELKKIPAQDLEAELYRKILRYNRFHTKAILGLADCLENGTPPQFEDLKYTWLESGNWMLENHWGLTKRVNALLVKDLRERSKSTPMVFPVQITFPYKKKPSSK